MPRKEESVNIFKIYLENVDFFSASHKVQPQYIIFTVYYKVDSEMFNNVIVSLVQIVKIFFFKRAI